VIDALMRYVVFGFIPGSFGEALLRQDAVDAKARAHPLIDDETIADMLEWTARSIPECIRGDIAEWCAVGGLHGSEPAVWVLFRLAAPSLYDEIIRRYPDVLSDRIEIGK
jgi:hypothetical protein